MNIYYKDYELSSFKLNDNGYLLPYLTESDCNLNNAYSNEISNFVIKPEDNNNYFEEADILTKINLNNEQYFDFNKTIIDIGSHVGVYSFRSEFKKGYLFEANKKMCVFAQMNLLIHNKFDSFKVYNVLLSDNKNKVKFDGFNNEYTFVEDLSYVKTQIDELNNIFIKKHSNITNTYYNDNIEYIIPHTLDEFHCENVGLIKVDVEGMEEKVLRGGIGTIIRNNYPPILFELWDNNCYLIDQSTGDNLVTYRSNEEIHNSLQNFLEDLGYNILWHWGNQITHLAIHK